MLKRLLQEPTTLFYFCVIVIKVLPHVPLMLGFKQQFLRLVFWLFLLSLFFLRYGIINAVVFSYKLLSWW
jgi:hypothetical protein